MACNVPLLDRYVTWHLRRRLRGFRVVRNVLIGSREISVLTPYGTVFQCDPDEHIGGAVLRHGFFEPEVMEALRPFLSASGTFWDIGANFGLYAVTAAALFPGMCVHAFEPIAELRSHLIRHADLNGVRVTSHALALSNASGSFEIYVPPTGASGRATLRKDYAGSDWQKSDVQTARGDELITRGELELPTVIKIDVEGLELQVVEGFGTLLSDRRLEAIVFESSRGLVDQVDREPLGRLLTAAGFHITRLTCGTPHHALENYLAHR